MHNIVKAVLAFIFILNIISYANSKDSISGFAIAAGMGNNYGGFGISSGYVFQINRIFAIYPFASVGDYTFEGKNLLGFALGSWFELGISNRFAFGGMFGTIGAEGQGTYGHIYNTNELVGPGLMLGYRGISPIGITWNVYIGIGYSINDKLYKNDIAPIFGTGVGYNF